jgi:pyruvate formate lyase activating enzyme
VVDGKHVIDRGLCTNCGACAAVCYAEALVMSGKEMSVEDIMAQVRQDKPYYEASGGGVTLSGGEVLCHLPFAIELAKACKKEGISVAIETNLSLPYEQIKPLLDEVDVVMADLKLFDEEAHERYTGKSSATVKENLARIIDLPLIVRTPLIPGVTATKENLLAIAASLVGKENLIYYQLLNFNPLGGTKYQSLDAENAFANARPYTAEEMDGFGAMLAGLPIKVKVGE